MALHLALAPVSDASARPPVSNVATLFTDVVKAAPSMFHPPRILTHDLVGRLHDSNAAARELRGQGYRVLDIDTMPDDGGKPILLLDLAGQPLGDFLRQCDASTSRPGSGRLTALFQGVRIVLEV